jgi:hypothetical protein
LQSSIGTAADGLLDRAQAIVLDEMIAMAGIEQALDDLITMQLAAGNELVKAEARAVKRVISSIT